MNSLIALESKQSVFSGNDKKWYYCSLAISSASSWEWLSENLVYVWLNKNATQFVQTVRGWGSAHIPLWLCEALFTTPDRYLHFRRVEDFIAMGKKYCFGAASTNYFSAISPYDRRKINHLILIRNHTVHESSLATKQYESVLKQYGMNRYVEPGVFLRAKTRVGGPSRLRAHLDALLSASRTIEARYP